MEDDQMEAAERKVRLWVIVIADEVAVFGAARQPQPRFGSDNSIALQDARLFGVVPSEDRFRSATLAIVGPSEGDVHVSQVVPAMTLYGVKAVLRCTPEAVAAWEKV